jgi:hypothetical protein
MARKTVPVTSLFLSYMELLSPISRGKIGRRYREEGLSAPLTNRVCIEEGGCTLMLLRPSYAGEWPKVPDAVTTYIVCLFYRWPTSSTPWDSRHTNL